ncbi:MAG: tetratricopeptide repeat protein [Myxococcales bacterium]|nr:tetratricopeptide repeat protein [Myxococcales bacterium]
MKHPDSIATHRAKSTGCYNNLGIVWLNKGESDRAIGYLEQALDVRLKALSEQHPDVAGTYNNLGVAWATEDLSKAKGYVNQALSIYIPTLGEAHPLTQETRQNLRRLRQD